MKGDCMKTFRQRKSQLGQGMTEYIIIVALVAIGAIGVYKYFGQTVNGVTAVAAQSLGGVQTSARSDVTSAASGAKNNSQAPHTMADFQTPK